MGAILSLVCVLLAANLDTVLLSMSWTIRRKQFTVGAVVMIAAVTTAATWLALTLGSWAAAQVSGTLAKKSGGALLLGVGVWMVVDALRERKMEEAPVPMRWKECLNLSLALAGNNIGMGAGADGGQPFGASDQLAASVRAYALWNHSDSDGSGGAMGVRGTERYGSRKGSRLLKQAAFCAGREKKTAKRLQDGSG